ncbi:hypothetical protein BV898_07530 [Hypsibius exemplaris]|uniref:Uncharacterized protein n=1 Tax=Hypsibius exemplaris TaxID=2072580 RepID=A0A1W0WSZ8_HYPEX|nr:hypothetical protein BV898_07530 [Hypsibius exemplaris]
MARWLGKFEEAHIDEKAEEFLVSAGYPSEVAKQIGPTISTIAFAQDGEEFVQTIATPSVGRSNELRFKLDQKAEIAGKNGAIVSSLFQWHEDTRTLHSLFQIGSGPQFTIDFAFAEDYNSAIKFRRTATVQAEQLIKRIA